jgi:integrase
VFAPADEPAGYWEELQKKKPERLVDLSKIRSKEDWIAAGERAFAEVDSFWTRTDDPSLIAQARNARNFEGVLKWPDGTVGQARWVVTEQGVMLSRSECRSCHRLTDDPDGKPGILAGPPIGRLPAGVQRLEPAGMGHPPALVRSIPRLFVGDTVPIAMWRMFTVPWAPDERVERLRTIDAQQLSLQETQRLIQIGAGIGVFPRPNGSPYYGAKVPDLRLLRYSRYIDATGTHRLRGPEDVARYAALITGADRMDFGSHRLLTDEQLRVRFRYAKVHCKFATHRLYKQVVEDHLEPALGKKKLDEITRADIRVLIASKIDEKLSKATVRNIMAPLRQMLGHAVEEGLILSNPASKLGRFSKETSARANSKKIIPYSAEEVQALLLKAERRSFDLYMFLLTAVLTGMRLGELLGLQWGDLDEISKCIHVKRAVTRRRIESPKNHLQRRIDASDTLLRNLQELRRRRKEEWLAKKKPVPEWVFCNDDGNFMNEYNFRTRKFYPLFKKAKGEEKPPELRQIRLHDLRHSYASLMLQQGESVTYVKEQMGHHSIQVTVDLYGHLIPGANRAAANRLEAHILSTSQSVALAAHA